MYEFNDRLLANTTLIKHNILISINQKKKYVYNFFCLIGIQREMVHKLS